MKTKITKDLPGCKVDSTKIQEKEVRLSSPENCNISNLLSNRAFVQLNAVTSVLVSA